jgi:hypothetical protein
VKLRVRVARAARPHVLDVANVNPKMLGRLAELEADLHTRRTRAEAEGWAR